MHDLPFLNSDNYIVPYYGVQHVTRYSDDPEHQTLNFEYIGERNYEVANDEVIRGCAFIILTDEGNYAGHKGVYIGQGPTTHSDLRSCAGGSEKYVPGPTQFNDENFCHGFYTNKGFFYTRRDIMIVVEGNNLPLAIPFSKINHRNGLLSTDIWDCNGKSTHTRNRHPLGAPNDNIGRYLDEALSSKETTKRTVAVFARNPGYSPIGSKKKKR